MSLDNLNPTTSIFRPLEINTVALDIVQHYALDAGDATLELSLSSLSFGVLTILSLTSIYFLLRQGPLATRTRRTNIGIPLLSTLILYISTATYMAALIWHQSSSNRWVSRAANGLFSPSYDAREEVAAFQDVVFKQSWMVTITTVMNFIIGDAIVWWRACVIWQHKAVYCIGSLLIATSLGMSAPISPFLVGVYMTALTSYSRESTILVLFISGNACAFAAGFMSLASNVLATALVAYKAWKHRRLVQKHFAAAGTRSQVLQALALLVESGSIYSVIMIFTVVYEIDVVPLHASAGAAFYRVAAYITRGCVIPLAAIYPAVIIVLVALRRSPIDAGVGLSRVGEAQVHDSESDSGHRPVFGENDHSAILGITVGMMPARDSRGVLPLEGLTPVRGRHMKAVEGLV